MRDSIQRKPGKPSVTGYVLVLKGQRQDLGVLDRGEAAGAVQLKRRDVAGFRLHRQPDGPGGGSRLADGADERPRRPPAPRTGDDLQIPQLPRTSQPQGGGNDHGRGQAS